MLVVNKNLNPKNICGKKNRSPAFSMSAIFSIPFVILAIVVSLCLPHREGRGVIIGLIFVVLLAVPIAMMISFRETSYIMGKDTKDFISKLEIAQKECYETEYWLELLFETGCIEETTYKSIQNDCGAMRRMLIASLNTIKSKQE